MTLVSKVSRAHSDRRMILPPASRRGERGFALLVVMLMAAAIAFSLYIQIPRYAFETMREREQLLQDRGNQYKRAIQVYYGVNKRYPARLEDLEKSNDKRFLRRRYKDPMTGKDEWRLIHTNGSALTDSLVQKPPAQNANGTPGAGILPGGGPLGANNLNSFSALSPASNPTAAANGVPQNGVPQPVPVNPAALRRPSDRNSGLPTPMPTPNLPQDSNYNAGLFSPGYNPNDPSTWPAITLAPTTPQNGVSGQPGPSGQILQPGQSFQQGQNAQPGQPMGIPGFGGQNAAPGQPTTQITPLPFGPQDQGVQTPLPFGPQATPFGDPFNGSPQQGNNGLQQGNGFPQQGTGFPQQGNGLVQPNPVPLQAQSGIPGQGPGQGGLNPQPTQIYNPGFGFAGNPLAPDPTPQPINPAVPVDIGNQLTNPRAQVPVPGAALPGGGLPGGANAQNPQAGPGIAGVASTFEGVSIKTYNKRTKYKEWEFVFDPSAGAIPGQQQNAAGQGLGQPGQGLGQTGQGQAPGQQGASGAFNLGQNPFAPNQNPQNPNQPGSMNATPAPNPFGQTPNPFGAPTQ